MASPDPADREEAFGDFHGAVNHQGDVYPCTMASLPFLYAMADNPTTPDRTSANVLLRVIGREAVEQAAFYAGVGGRAMYDPRAGDRAVSDWGGDSP
ncbi:hypothetical protein [Streptomyces sp. NPDC003943]